jgi:hypothetical protein
MAETLMTKGMVDTNVGKTKMRARMSEHSLDVFHKQQQSCRVQSKSEETFVLFAFFVGVFLEKKAFHKQSSDDHPNKFLRVCAVKFCVLFPANCVDFVLVPPVHTLRPEYERT